MLQRQRLDSRSIYRSVRYKINRTQQTRTADPSACNFRIKRNSFLDSTMTKTFGTQQPKASMTIDFSQTISAAKNDKPTYLQTFHSLMDPSQILLKNRNSQPRPDTQRGYTISPQQIKQPNKKKSIILKQLKQSIDFRHLIDSHDRVFIPEFQQNQKQVSDSQHHILAPFNTPFSHVKHMYLNANSELKSQRHQMCQIKAGLRKIQNSKNQQLKNIKDQVENHFDKIRRILRKNQIQQQQKKLKTKRQLQSLTTAHNNNIDKFKQLSQKSSSMQVCIFNSTPYDLKINMDKNQLNPQRTKLTNQFSDEVITCYLEKQVYI